MKIAVVRTGGKQFLVKENDEITVDQIKGKPNDKLDLETLMVFSDDGAEIDLGKPLAKTKVTAKLVENLRGDKIRVAKFKSKVRYRKVRGFRARLSKIKIVKI